MSSDVRSRSGTDDKRPCTPRLICPLGLFNDGAEWVWDGRISSTALSLISRFGVRVPGGALAGSSGAVGFGIASIAENPSHILPFAAVALLFQGSVFPRFQSLVRRVYDLCDETTD